MIFRSLQQIHVKGAAILSCYIPSRRENQSRPSLVLEDDYAQGHLFEFLLWPHAFLLRGVSLTARTYIAICAIAALSICRIRHCFDYS